MLDQNAAVSCIPAGPGKGSTLHCVHPNVVTFLVPALGRIVSCFLLGEDRLRPLSFIYKPKWINRKNRVAILPEFLNSRLNARFFLPAGRLLVPARVARYSNSVLSISGFPPEDQ